MRRRHALTLSLLCALAAPALAGPDEPARPDPAQLVEAHRAAHDLLVGGDGKGAAEKLAPFVERAPGIAAARLALVRCMYAHPEAEAGVRVLRDRTHDPVALAWCEVLVQVVAFHQKTSALERSLEAVDARAKEWGALVEAERALQKELALAEVKAVTVSGLAERIAANAVERAHVARVALEELGETSEQSRMEGRLWWSARRDLLLRLRDALLCEELKGERVEAERKAVKDKLAYASERAGTAALGALLGNLFEAGLRWSTSEGRSSNTEQFLAGYRRALEHQGLGPTDLELRLQHASLEREHLDQARQLASALARQTSQADELADEAAMQWLTGGTASVRDVVSNLRRAAGHSLMSLDAAAVRLVEAEAEARRAPTAR